MNSNKSKASKKRDGASMIQLDRETPRSEQVKNIFVKKCKTPVTNTKVKRAPRKILVHKMESVQKADHIPTVVDDSKPENTFSHELPTQTETSSHRTYTNTVGDADSFNMDCSLEGSAKVKVKKMDELQVESVQSLDDSSPTVFQNEHVDNMMYKEHPSIIEGNHNNESKDFKSKENADLTTVRNGNCESQMQSNAAVVDIKSEISGLHNAASITPSNNMHDIESDTNLDCRSAATTMDSTEKVETTSISGVNLNASLTKCIEKGKPKYFPNANSVDEAVDGSKNDDSQQNVYQEGSRSSDSKKEMNKKKDYGAKKSVETKLNSNEATNISENILAEVAAEQVDAGMAFENSMECEMSCRNDHSTVLDGTANFQMPEESCPMSASTDVAEEVNRTADAHRLATSNLEQSDVMSQYPQKMNKFVGRNISGRFWKNGNQSQRASAQRAAGVKAIGMEWKPKLAANTEKKLIMEKEKELKEAKRLKIEEGKQRRLENEKRKTQNALKNVAYDEISDINKLNKLSKRKFRQLKKLQFNPELGVTELVPQNAGRNKKAKR